MTTIQHFDFITMPAMVDVVMVDVVIRPRGRRVCWNVARKHNEIGRQGPII